MALIKESVKKDEEERKKKQQERQKAAAAASSSSKSSGVKFSTSGAPSATNYRTDASSSAYNSDGTRKAQAGSSGSSGNSHGGGGGSYTPSASALASEQAKRDNHSRRVGNRGRENAEAIAAERKRQKQANERAVYNKRQLRAEPVSQKFTMTDDEGREVDKDELLSMRAEYYKTHDTDRTRAIAGAFDENVNNLIGRVSASGFKDSGEISEIQRRYRNAQNELTQLRMRGMDVSEAQETLRALGDAITEQSEFYSGFRDRDEYNQAKWYSENRNKSYADVQAEVDRLSRQVGNGSARADAAKKLEFLEADKYNHMTRREALDELKRTYEERQAATPREQLRLGANNGNYPDRADYTYKIEQLKAAIAGGSDKRALPERMFDRNVNPADEQDYENFVRSTQTQWADDRTLTELFKDDKKYFYRDGNGKLKSGKAKDLIDAYVNEQGKKSAEAVNQIVTGGGNGMPVKAQADVTYSISDALAKAGYDVGRAASAYERYRNAKDNAEREEQTRKFASAHPVIASVGSVAENMFGAEAAAVGTIGRLAAAPAYDRSRQLIDVNAPEFALTRQATDIRDQISEDIAKRFESGFGKAAAVTLYQAGMSLADMGAAFLASGMLVTGGSKGAQMMYQAIMSSSAGVNSLTDTMKNGGTVGQAIMTGAASALFEALFEKVSIGQLAEAMNAKTLGQTVKRALLSTFAEGTEEVNTDIANMVADALINGDNSQFNRSVLEYMRQGEDAASAKALAVTDTLKSLGQSFAGGALAGGFSSFVVGMGANAVRNVKEKRAVDRAVGRISSPDSSAAADNINAVRAMAENAPLTENEQKKIDRAVRSAEKAQAKIEEREEAGRKKAVTSGAARAVGRMINEASDARAAVVRQTTKDAISGRLAELGTDPASVGALTETVYRAYEAEREGRRPSKADVSAITHDGNALTALNELREWRNRNADIAWISAAQETAEQAMDELSRKARAAAGADGGITDSYTADAPAGRFAARTSAGEAVEVDRITETGKGEIRVGLTDGTDGTVRTDGTGDVEFDDPETARLFDAAATLGGAAEANAFIAAYAPGQDIDAYAKAYRAEYAAGLFGRDRVNGDVLTAEQADSAYEAGVNRRGSGNVDAAKVLRAVRENRPGQGVSVLTKDGYEGLSKSERNALELADAYGREHGISYIVVDTIGELKERGGRKVTAALGVHIEGTNVIFVTKNNPVGSITASIGHETWHWVRDTINRSGTEDARERIREMTGELLETLRGLDGYDFDARRETLRRLNENAGKTLTDAELDEEQVANGMWDLITNEEAVKELASKDRNLFTRIKEGLQKIIGRLRESAERYGVAEVKALAQAQDALEKFNRIGNEAVRMADEARNNAEYNAGSNAELSDEESAGRFMARESEDGLRQELDDLNREQTELNKRIEALKASDEYNSLIDRVVANEDGALEDYVRWINESGLNDAIRKQTKNEERIGELNRQREKLLSVTAAQEESEAIKKSGMSEAGYFRKQAVSEFGYTPYFYDAGYMLPDGKLLNFSGEKGKHFGSRGQDHRGIGIIFENTTGTDAMNRFMNYGNIRVMAETPGLDIYSGTEPTAEQYAAIRKMAREYAGEGYFSVDFSDENGRNAGSLEYEDRINPDRIVNDIKHYYATGELREQSDVDRFRYMARETTPDGTNFTLLNEDALSKIGGEEDNSLENRLYKFLRGRFKKTVLPVGDNGGKAYIGRDALKEFVHPAKHIADDIYESKVTAGTELDNILADGTYLSDEADDGSHEGVINWTYYRTYWAIKKKSGDVEVFEGKINIKQTHRGFLFHDVTDIKNVTKSMPGTNIANYVSDSLSDNNMLSQSSENVNTSEQFMVRETDERYLSAVRAGDMDAARSMVDEAADIALSKSAARGGNGKLLRLKHGTDAEFTAFDYTKHGGKNGAAEGIGIYLTDDPEVANKYGSRQLDLFADIRRPATSWKKTVTRGELARVIEAACRREAEQMVAEDGYDTVNEALKDTWISNFVYTYDYGNIRDAYRATADIILQSNDNDMNIVNELLGDQGIRDNQQTYDFYHDILTPITGIDGLWTKWKQGDGSESNIILAFEPSQVKSAEPVTYDDNDNVIPISERFNRDKDEFRYMVRESHDRDYRLNRRYRDAVKAFGYDMSGDELLLDDPAGEYEALARMPEPEYAVFRERDEYVRDAIRRISEAKKPDPKDIMTVAKYYTVGDKVSGALSQKETAAMLTAFYDYAANAGASTDAGDFGTSLMELAYKLASRIVDGQLKYYPINPVWADDAAVVEDARTVVNKYLNQGRIYDKDAEGQALGARQSRTGVKDGEEFTRIGMDELYSVVETERWRNAFKDNYNNPAEVLDEMIDVVAEAEPTYANYYDVFDGQEWTDCQPDAVVKVTEQLLNDALVIDAYARQRADYGMVPAADLDQARDEFDEKVKEVRREADRQIKEVLKQNDDLRKSREEWENVYREDFNREREKLSSAARENQKLRRSREGIMATSQKRRRELTATRRELKRETARADRAERNVERQKAKTEKAELEARRRLEDEREKRRRQRGEFNDALKQQRADLKHEAANAVHNALMRERQKVVAQRAKQQTLQAVVKLRKAVSTSRYEMPEGIKRLAELTLGLFDDNALVMPADLQRTAVAVMEAVDELNLPEDGDVYGELVTSIITATENMQSAPALYEYAALAPNAADEAGRTNAEKYEAAVHDMVVATERIVKRFNAEAAYMKKITAEVSKDIDSRKYGERSKVRQSLDRAAAMAESAFRRAVMEEPYVARRIGGTFGKLMDDFRRTGENKYWTYVFGAQERLSALIDKYNAREFIKDKSKDVFTFQTHTGQKLALRADQAMGVYAVWLRERANVDEQGRPRTAHLAAGGIVFTNGEMADGTKVPLSAGKFQLNDADVRKIKEFLDKDGRKLTKLTQEIVKYMTDEVGEWGNKASLAMYGVKKFEDRSYYPFETLENGLVTQSKTDVSGEMGGQKKGVTKFSGMGMAKDITADAMNPVKVNNFFDVVAGHINSVAAYGAYAEGQQNLLWIMNYRTAAADGVPGTMFREYLDDAYGKGTAAWVSKWLSDLAGGQEKDNAFSAVLFRSFKGAAVAANLSVTLKQPTSIGRALAYLGPQYFVGNPFSAAGVRTERSAYKEALKWSGAAKSKLAGGSFDINDGRSAAEFMLQQPGKRINNLQDLTGLGARIADEVTWGNIWNACKRWTRKNMPALTGDEFMKATAQKFDEVIQLTQVYDEQMLKSELMRNQSFLAKSATMFMSEPLKQLNMFTDALYQVTQNPKSAQAWKYFARTNAALLVQALLTAAATGLVKVWRDRDDEKELPERFAVGFIDGAVDELNILGKIPFIKDFISLFQGYDVSRGDMELVADLIDSVGKLAALLEPGNKKLADLDARGRAELWADTIAGTVGNVTSFFGVPVKNVYRDVMGMVRSAPKVLTVGNETPERMAWALKEGLRDAFTVHLGDDYEKSAFDFLIPTVDDIGDSLLEGDTDRAETQMTQLASYLAYKGDANTTEKVRSKLYYVIKEDVKKGLIDDQTARDYVFNYLGKRPKSDGTQERYTEDEAYWLVKEWHFKADHPDEKFAEYRDLDKAVDRKADVTEALTELTEHGFTTAQVSNRIYKHLQNRYDAGEISEDQARELLEYYAGYAHTTKSTGLMAEFELQAKRGELTEQELEELKELYGNDSDCLSPVHYARRKVEQWSETKAHEGEEGWSYSMYAGLDEAVRNGASIGKELDHLEWLGVKESTVTDAVGRSVTKAVNSYFTEQIAGTGTSAAQRAAAAEKAGKKAEELYGKYVSSDPDKAWEKGIKTQYKFENPGASNGSVYARLDDALDAEKNVNATVSEYMEHGKTASGIFSHEYGRYFTQYCMAYQKGDTKTMGAIYDDLVALSDATEYSSAKNISKTLTKWRGKVDDGSWKKSGDYDAGYVYESR